MNKPAKQRVAPLSADMVARLRAMADAMTKKLEEEHDPFVRGLLLRELLELCASEAPHPAFEPPIDTAEFFGSVAGSALRALGVYPADVARANALEDLVHFLASAIAEPWLGPFVIEAIAKIDAGEPWRTKIPEPPPPFTPSTPAAWPAAAAPHPVSTCSPGEDKADAELARLYGVPEAAIRGARAAGTLGLWDSPEAIQTLATAERDQGLRNALLGDVLAFVGELAACTHASAEALRLVQGFTLHVCRDCGACRLEAKGTASVWGATKLAERAKDLDGLVKSCGAISKAVGRDSAEKNDT